MSIEALKQELASLAPRERKQIIAFLVALQDERDIDYRTALARKIDDKDSSHWVDLDELDHRFVDQQG